MTAYVKHDERTSIYFATRTNPTKSLSDQAQDIIRKIDMEFQKRCGKLQNPTHIVKTFTISVFLRKPNTKGVSYSVPLPSGVSQQEYNNLSRSEQKAVVLNYSLSLKDEIVSKINSESKLYELTYLNSNCVGPWNSTKADSDCCGEPSMECEILGGICRDIGQSVAPIHCNCGDAGPLAPIIVAVAAIACILCVLPGCVYGSYLGCRNCAFCCVNLATTRDRTVDGWELVFTLKDKNGSNLTDY